MTDYTKDGSFPAQLPPRITLSDGRVRTNPATFSPEEIVDAGYIAADPRPEPGENQTVTWGGEGWTVRDKTADELATEVESLRARMHQQVRDAYSRAMSVISADYPAEEREGWAEQVEAAHDVLAGNSTALIDALRDLTGETALEMANTIIAKRTQYQALYGAMTAKRRFLDEQIGAAAGLSELEAIDVEEIWNN